jgi:hypothetical protein
MNVREKSKEKDFQLKAKYDQTLEPMDTWISCTPRFSGRYAG